MRRTELVAKHNGAMVTITIGDGNIARAAKMMTGSIRREDRGQEGRGQIVGMNTKPVKVGT